MTSSYSFKSHFRAITHRRDRPTAARFVAASFIALDDFRGKTSVNNFRALSGHREGSGCSKLSMISIRLRSIYVVCISSQTSWANHRVRKIRKFLRRDYWRVIQRPRAVGFHVAIGIAVITLEKTFASSLTDKTVSFSPRSIYREFALSHWSYVITLVVRQKVVGKNTLARSCNFVL